MAVKTKEELLQSLNEILGEDTSDAALALVEDVTDTLNSNAGDGVDWQQRYNENDAAWRKRYRDRFMGNQSDPEPDPTNPPDPDSRPTYSNLFKEE